MRVHRVRCDRSSPRLFFGLIDVRFRTGVGGGARALRADRFVSDSVRAFGLHGCSLASTVQTEVAV